MSNYNYPPGCTDRDIDGPEQSNPSTENYWCAECGKYLHEDSDWVEGDEPGEFFCGKRCKRRCGHPDDEDV